MPTDSGGADAVPAGGSRMLSTPGHRLLAAAAAATVLVVGYAARPHEPLAARLEEAPGPLLQEAVEQREPQTVFRALQRVGASSLPYVARVSAAAGPVDFWSDLPGDAAAVPTDDERYGVVVGPAEIVAAGASLAVGDDVAVILGDGRQLQGTVTAHFRDRGLALISAITSAPFTVPPIAAAVAPGEAVVAVGVGTEGEVIAPVFVAGTTRSGILAATPLDAFEGMGVFTEGGALAGIIAGTGEGFRILRPDRALAPVPFRDPLPPALGVALTRGQTGTPGVVSVAGVDPAGPAARLRLQAGDVLLDASGQPVPTIEAGRRSVREALDTGIPLRVLREGDGVILRPSGTSAAR